MFKKIIYIFIFLSLVSCGETFDSVKRGLTGAKNNSADEFLVKKKDPLILPPDYENLPAPDEQEIAFDENSLFETTLEDDDTEDTSASKSVESSILRQIQKK